MGGGVVIVEPAVVGGVDSVEEVWEYCLWEVIFHSGKCEEIL